MLRDACATVAFNVPELGIHLLLHLCLVPSIHVEHATPLLPQVRRHFVLPAVLPRDRPAGVCVAHVRKGRLAPPRRLPGPAPARLYVFFLPLLDR